jgi:hypothetical protein
MEIFSLEVDFSLALIFLVWGNQRSRVKSRVAGCIHAYTNEIIIYGIYDQTPWDLNCDLRPDGRDLHSIYWPYVRGTGAGEVKKII